MADQEVEACARAGDQWAIQPVNTSCSESVTQQMCTMLHHEGSDLGGECSDCCPVNETGDDVNRHIVSLARFIGASNKGSGDGFDNEIVTIAPDDIIQVQVEDVVATEEVVTDNVCKVVDISFDQHDEGEREVAEGDSFKPKKIKRQRKQLENGISSQQRKSRRKKPKTSVFRVDTQRGLDGCEPERDWVVIEQFVEEPRGRMEVFEQTEKKRQRDREVKRIQRMDPQYKESEREKARELMQSKRSDPLYRAMEREKDKERRRKARLKPEFREVEKLRDKLAKKEARKMKLVSKGPE